MRESVDNGAEGIEGEFLETHCVMTCVAGRLRCLLAQPGAGRERKVMDGESPGGGLRRPTAEPFEQLWVYCDEDRAITEWRNPPTAVLGPGVVEKHAVA